MVEALVILAKFTLSLPKILTLYGFIGSQSCNLKAKPVLRPNVC